MSPQYMMLTGAVRMPAMAQPTEAEIQQTVQEALAAAGARVEAAVQQAQAVQDAQQTQPAQPAQPGAPQQPFNIRLGENGLVIETTDQNGVTTTNPFDASNVIPPQVPDILLIGVLGLIGMILAFPIGRAIARYIDRRGLAPRVPEEVNHRLGAIEQAVDTVAIEMERMSEANRYTTRLLSERIGSPDFAAGASSRPAAVTKDSVSR